MTDTTAAFYDVNWFDGRSLSLGECLRAVRPVVDRVIVGLAAVGAIGLLVTTVTVAAAWILNAALITHPSLHANTLLGPASIALVSHDPTLARATDFAARDRAPTALQSFETQWARATGRDDGAAGPFVPLLPEDPIETASNVAPAPVTSSPVPGDVTPEVAGTLNADRIVAPAPEGAVAAAGTATRQAKLAPGPAKTIPLPRPHPIQTEIALLPDNQTKPQVAAATTLPTPAPEKRAALQPADTKSMSLPDRDSRTAVYDIAAHTVYLPNGTKLEAHSGLGDKLDNPRYVAVKDRGPTPPNVYDLVLREQLFHEVRAIRLNPVDGGKMFGRDGMLAHTYMLGPNGQSNGCVSFKDYPAFLHAYLKGDVARLVVVPHLGDTSWRTAAVRREPESRYADNNP